MACEDTGRAVFGTATVSRALILYVSGLTSFTISFRTASYRRVYPTKSEATENRFIFRLQLNQSSMLIVDVVECAIRQFLKYRLYLMK